MRKYQAIYWAASIVGLAASASLITATPSAEANLNSRCKRGTRTEAIAPNSTDNNRFKQPSDRKLATVSKRTQRRANQETSLALQAKSATPERYQWRRIQEGNDFGKLEDVNCSPDSALGRFSSSKQDNNDTITNQAHYKWNNTKTDKSEPTLSNSKSAKSKKKLPKESSERTTKNQSKTNSRNNIKGWWRGDNDNLYGIYQRSRSRNINGTIYTNNGMPFETFTGTIDGNSIMVNWRNLCTSARGSREGVSNANTIEWTSGDLRDTQMRKVNNEPTVQRDTACAPPQSTSLSGWWTTQGRQNWWLGKQIGNKVSLTKFVDGNNGKPVIQFTGRLDSEGNSEGSLRQCGQQSGSSYSLQRRTNNLYYFGGNNRSLSRSRTAPPFRSNLGETCSRESTDINGWWRDQRRRFWEAEQNGNQVKITRYRESDGKAYSIFQGTKRNRSGTDFYAYGILKNCFSFRNTPSSFSLIDGQLRFDESATVLTRYQRGINFATYTECDPASAQEAARTQALILDKTVKLTDYDPLSPDERGTKTYDTKEIILSRPSGSGLSTTNSKFVGAMEGCTKHGFYVDEVTYDEWDQVRLDSQGVASFYINVALRETDHETSECPIFATVIGRYYTIVDGEGAWPSIADHNVNYHDSLMRGPFLTVRPGETKTRKLTIDKSDGRIEITYSLTNHTQTIRPWDN